ncbi:hypothetical protein P1P68_12600 [Streptomyces scabiei]|uniref:hypothetical protein n=1 Tax=Streptomyces scabiei TaxID=1930 RepID=UPI0029900934|nr:hypothetical protein [Streptomyces scabiei]MDW8805598.1 hypothetical protein [Streptomyces scabiei]
MRHATGPTGDAAITQTTTYVPKAQDTKGSTHVHALKSAEARTVTPGSTGSSAKEVTAAQSFANDEAGNTIRRTKAATDLSPAVDQKLDTAAVRLTTGRSTRVVAGQGSSRSLRPRC